jgi:hypothetical protein
VLDLTSQTPPVPVPSRFVRERTIAEGEVVSVARARDLLTGRAVALVQMRPERAADAFLRARFAREARLLEAIDHPNVVRVIASGIEHGQPFIATEAIAGRTLAEIVRARGPLPAGEAIGLARQMLAGLGAIHAAGLLHLKLTPRTILVGDDGNLRITDIGIASLEGADGDAPGTAVRVARYLPPELIEGGDVSEATDLYAVGAVLFEVLTGQPPFPGENPVLVRFAHVQAPPPVPSRVVTSDIPPELDAVVVRALAKDPTRRYVDARAMASALPADSTATGVDRVIAQTAMVGAVPPARSITDRAAASPIGALGVGRIERGGWRRQAAGGWAWPIAIACVAIAILIVALVLTLSGNVRVDDVTAGVAVDARESGQPTVTTSGRIAPTPTGGAVRTADEDAAAVSTASAFRAAPGPAARTPKSAR